MKLLLALSVLLNLFLGYQVLTRPPVVMSEVQLAVPAQRPRPIEQKVSVEAKLSQPKPQVTESPKASLTTRELDDVEVQDQMNKVAQDRDDFLNEELGLTPEHHKKIQRIKKQFQKLYQDAIPKDQVGELSIQQRRRFLELDIARDKELSEALGAERWNRFVKFRDQYNQRMFKEDQERGVIYPMDL